MFDPARFPTLGASIIRSVDAGYEVEHKGESLTVEKSHPVYRGNEIFMEHSDYEAFKGHPSVQNWIEPNWSK